MKERELIVIGAFSLLCPGAEVLVLLAPLRLPGGAGCWGRLVLGGGKGVNDIEI